MEGVVDHLMRRTLSGITTSEASCGIDICVTEFVRVNDHVLPEKVFHRICPEIQNTAHYPVRVQLLGSNPQALADNARKLAQLGVDGIDLNFGCPAKTVNKNRGGACLLNDTELIYTIVAAVRDAVPATIPVTAKIRLGYEARDSYLENALAIEKAGANELVVHARSKADGYNPPAYWRYIAEIKHQLRIPVIANGEIWTVSDYLACRQQSLCDDVMLGRGLLARPDLATAIKAHLANRPYIPLQWHQLAPYISTFFESTCATYPAKHLGNRLKQWLSYLQRTYPQAEQLFAQIKRSRSQVEIAAALANTCK